MYFVHSYENKIKNTMNETIIQRLEVLGIFGLTLPWEQLQRCKMKNLFFDIEVRMQILEEMFSPHRRHLDWNDVLIGASALHYISFKTLLAANYNSSQGIHCKILKFTLWLNDSLKVPSVRTLRLFFTQPATLSEMHNEDWISAQKFGGTCSINHGSHCLELRMRRTKL